MSGFNCNFVQEPVDYLQCYCPICLLILREPQQDTCCGKSFCRACIRRIKVIDQPCPTCQKENFDSFPNLGLQQTLRGFRVFCSNKEGGCGWQGELGQLDKHLNVNPGKEKQFVGCAYTNLKCLFCGKLCLRREIEDHQTSQCSQRPFTCEMCGEYEFTYEDVVTSHAPECKCRPVECPNTCGASDLQHQHLEEHVSSQCPLTPVECEFSYAGCDAKVHRRDLPSHLSDNMVTHMLLLARENRKLKQQLKTQEQQMKQELMAQEEMHQEQLKKLQQEACDTKKTLTTYAQQFSRLPPLYLTCKVKLLEVNHSEPFYSHAGGYKLQLETVFYMSLQNALLMIKFTLLESEFAVQLPCKLQVIAKLINQVESINYITIKYTVDSNQDSEFVDVKRGNPHFDKKCKIQITDVLIV